MTIQSTYRIPISNGIFAHCKKIGGALWVFLWLIDRTTKEVGGEGLVLGGTQVRASFIANDLGIATRTVHEQIERLCSHGYVRRIDGGDGLPSGYAVQKSKKWGKNQAATDSDSDHPNLAEIREPSQESANQPRGITVDPRGNPLYPRGNPLPIRKTVQDSTEQQTREAVERVFAFYCLKVGHDPHRYALTTARRHKAELRMTERVKAHLGDMHKAEQDLLLAVEKLASSTWNIANGRTDWTAQIFKSQEEFEKRLNSKGQGSTATEPARRYINTADAYSSPEYADTADQSKPNKSGAAA